MSVPIITEYLSKCPKFACCTSVQWESDIHLPAPGIPVICSFCFLLLCKAASTAGPP